MSRDFQFISVVDDLSVSTAEDIPDAEPRTLRLTSPGGFNSAQRVIINDFAINTFIIASDRLILVEIGDSFGDLLVSSMRIVVVASTLTSTRRVRLLFGPTRRSKQVTGLQKLVQHVVKIMLTSLGTNRFNVAEGGDLVRGLSGDLSLVDRSRVNTVLARAVETTQDQIIASQASERGLPAAERLLSLSLDRVTYFEAAAEVQAEVRLVTFTGQALDIPLVL